MAKFIDIQEDKVIPETKIVKQGVSLRRNLDVEVGFTTQGESSLWVVWIEYEYFILDLPIIPIQDIPADVGMKYWWHIVAQENEFDEIISAILASQVKTISFTKHPNGVRITLTTKHNRQGNAFVPWQYKSDQYDNIWKRIFKVSGR